MPTEVTPAGSAGSDSYRPSRGDRGGLWVFILAGLALTIGTAVFAVIRIAELLSPGPTAVAVEFAGLPAEVPAGAGTLQIDVTSATIHVTELPVASLAAGVASPVLATLVTATIAVCLIALAVSVMRGRIFSKRNSVLVATAGFTGLLGFSLANLCDTMLANGALAWATDRQVDNIVASFNPGAFLLAAFVIALVSTVFVVGERMQRDTEGLI